MERDDPGQDPDDGVSVRLDTLADTVRRRFGEVVRVDRDEYGDVTIAPGAPGRVGRVVDR